MKHLQPLIMPSLNKLLVGFALASVAASQACPPRGAVLPAPRRPASSNAIKKASDALRSSLDQRFETIEASGISVGVKSIHEDKPLFDYHHTPKVAEDIGTDKIDADTIYRVGSISKLIPTLAVLQQTGVNLDDSVLEYIPELKGDSDDGISGTVWEDVTIRGLMSHMSGIATDSEQVSTSSVNDP
jgi:CubicO group peptidase (beta-lactamase class C family)